MEFIPEEIIENADDFHSRLSKEQTEAYFADFFKQQPFVTAFLGDSIDRVKDKDSWIIFIKTTTITVHAYKYYNLEMPKITRRNFEFVVKKWIRQIKASDNDVMIELMQKQKDVLGQPFLFKMYDEMIFGTSEEPSTMKKFDQVYIYSTLMMLVEAFNYEVNRLLS